jgi:hypothetical protein
MLARAFDDIPPRRGKIVAGSFCPPLVVDPFATGTAGGGGQSGFGNPTWLQQLWFVSWLTGSDASDGKTPATAVKTIEGGIVSKWQTTSPQLAPGITRIKVLGPEPLGAETVVLTPVGRQSTLILDGTEGTLLVATGTLDGVVPKIYGDPGQTLSASSVSAFSSAAVGDIVTNSDHSSSSTVHALLPGHAVELNQPLAGYQGMLTYFPSPTEVNTWAPGDHVQLLRPPTLNLAVLQMSGGGNVVPAGDRAIVQVISIRVLDASGTVGESTFAPYSDDTAIQLFDCTIEPYLDMPFTDYLLCTLINCAVLGGASVPNGSAVYAGAIDLGVDMLGGYIGFDCNVSAGMICTLGNNRLGRVRIGPSAGIGGYAVFVYPSCTVYNVFEEGVEPGHAAIWGPGAINLFGNAGWYLTPPPPAVTWTGNMFKTGLQLNSSVLGQDFNSAAVGNPFPAPVVISAASLDAAISHGLQDVGKGARFMGSA